MYKEKSSAATLFSLMSSACDLYLKGEMEKEEVLKTYSTIIDLYDVLMETSDDPKLEEAKKVIDQKFLESNVATCQDVDEMYSERFTQNPDDLKLLRLMYKIYNALDCEGSQTYYQSFENLVKQDTTPRLLIAFARLAKANGDYDKAEQHYLIGIRNQTDEKLQTAYYIELSNMLKIKGDYVSARKYCKEALKMDADNGDALMLLGSIYASGPCDDVDGKAKYWIAVDYFARAKKADNSKEEEAVSLISKYSQYFPDNERVFFHGLSAGQSYTLTCWMGETTIVRIKN
jgi:tetratricopeptide (TPR) repeat protein